MLQHTLKRAAEIEINNIQIGMAHRVSFKCFNSRARKPYEMMISEFMHTDPMKFLPEDGSLELTRRMDRRCEVSLRWCEDNFFIWY